MLRKAKLRRPRTNTQPRDARKNLREPHNPRTFFPRAMLVIGLLGLLSIFAPILLNDEQMLNTMPKPLYGLALLSSCLISMTGFWAEIRMNWLDARHTEVKIGNSLSSSIVLITIFIFLSILAANYIDENPLPVIATGIILAVGTLISGEPLIAISNEKYNLQMQALEKLAHNQELTIEEIAVLSSDSKESVRRALGRRDNVPASVARDWLENDKGIKCPPVEK